MIAHATTPMVTQTIRAAAISPFILASSRLDLSRSGRTKESLRVFNKLPRLTARGYQEFGVAADPHLKSVIDLRVLLVTCGQMLRYLQSDGTNAEACSAAANRAINPIHSRNSKSRSDSPGSARMFSIVVASERTTILRCVSVSVICTDIAPIQPCCALLYEAQTLARHATETS